MKKILLLLLLLPIVFAREYHIADSIVSITVFDNGLVNIIENLTYDLQGCYDIIYREIPVMNSQILEIKGTADNDFAPYTNLADNYFTYEFRFNDSQCDKAVSIILEYNMSNVVDSYDDISGIHFMFWGRDFPLTDSLTANINLPNNIISYWIHNSNKGYSNSSGNEIIFSKKNVNAGNWIETQVIFERLNNNTYSNLKAGIGLELINDAERNYIILQDADAFFLIAFFIIPFILFFYVYNKHGREETIGNFNSFEFDIPTNDSPAVVKAILNNNDSPDVNSFIATIFELARKKYLEILGSEKSVEIRIIKEPERLTDYEKVAFLFLKKYQNNGIIRWDELKIKLLSANNSIDFTTRLEAFNKSVIKSFDRKEYYNNEGNLKFLEYSFFCILIYLAVSFSFGFLISKVMPNYESYAPFYLVFSGVLIIFLNIIGIYILGRWTKKGRAFESKWKSFRKYLNDYSLLSRHPAQSIVIWERFLVYAIVLGAAGNVIKVMKLKIAQTSKGNAARIYAYPYLYASLRSSFQNSISRSNSYRSGSGGFGGGGGGFGGGHGGGGGGAR